ncbi:MAG: hypothetical protein PWQ82_1318 [Thermosediminibacterales bacterium]|nr:hypothetical protein [Thermosediminibacterales bacterium]
MRWRAYISLFLVLMLISGISPQSARGQETAEVSFESPGFVCGDTFSTYVMISGIEDLYGLSIELEYDAGMIEVEEIIPGDFVLGDVKHTEKQENRVLYIESRKGKTAGVSGSGRLAEIKFKPQKSGLINMVDIITIKLGNSWGEPIPFTIIPQNIIVDMDAPEIDIDELPEKTYDSKVTISGKLSDANPDRVMIDNTLVSLLDNETGRFNFSLPIVKGINDIIIEGYDKAGNKTAVKKTVTRLVHHHHKKDEDSWVKDNKDETNKKVEILDTAKHWARSSVEWAVKKRLMRLDETKHFYPELPINRKRFIKLFRDMFELIELPEQVLQQYINRFKEYSLEYVSNENNTITRAEMARMIFDSLNIKDSTGLETYFTDYKDIPGETLKAAGALLASGIIQGYSDSSFRGNKPVTRAQAAVIAHRVFVYLTKPEIDFVRDSKKQTIQSEGHGPLVIESPAEICTFTDRDTYRVKGWLEPGYRLYVNYKEVKTDENGLFSFDCDTGYGYNTVRLDFYYTNGSNTGTDVRYIRRELNPPVVISVYPTDNSFFKELTSPIAVSLKVSDTESGIDLDNSVFTVDGISSKEITGFTKTDIGSPAVMTIYSELELSFYKNFLDEKIGEGAHTVEYSVYNNFGQAACGSWQFTIDSTNPYVEILSPAPDTSHFDRITVTGSVYDQNLQEYSLYYFPKDSPGQQVLISSGSSSVDGSELGTIDLNSLPEGEYVIRLTAVDKAGNSSETFLNFTIENPPEVGSITGTLSLEAKGPAEGIKAEIVLPGGEKLQETFSGGNGIFVLENVECGSYEIKFSYPGYKSETLHAEVYAETSAPINITLKAGDINGDGNINDTDLQMMINKLNESEPVMDFNLDNIIDIYDIIILLRNVY